MKWGEERGTEFSLGHGTSAVRTERRGWFSVDGGCKGGILMAFGGPPPGKPNDCGNVGSSFPAGSCAVRKLLNFTPESYRPIS